jgi:Fe-S-cluster containining protein
MTADTPTPAQRIPLPLVRLAAVPDQPGACRTARVQLTVGSQPVPLEITVPAGPARMRELLPILQGFTDVIVAIGVRTVEEQGQTISCRRGCGACCRQPVPVALSEAHALARLVANLPEPRRSQVRSRFAAAVERLATSEMLEQFQQLKQPSREEIRAVGLGYFALAVACPFLEDESCSIHPDRPLACREYLVTSPAAECSQPSAAIRMVPLPIKPSRPLRASDKATSQDQFGWIPLTFALEWAEQHPEAPPGCNGPELIQEFFSRLTTPPIAGDKD